MSRITHVGQAQVPAFLAYCAAHRFDHDESFLDEHSLSLFRPGPEEKAVILVDGDGVVRGAASLMLQPSYREMGRARFRIFHAESGQSDDYRALFQALLPVDEGFPLSYLFLSDKAAATQHIVRDMGFLVDRRSWLLGRPLGEPLDPRIPPDLLLVPCEPGNGRHVDDWCAVINDAFDGMAGHSTLTPATFAQLQDPSAVFAGGDLLLYEGSCAIGLVSVKKDMDEPAENQGYLGPVAVIKARQKKGLGRALLRAGLAAAQARGFARCVLTVNAENESALGLYLEEGFTRMAVYTCWAVRNGPSGLETGRQDP